MGGVRISGMAAARLRSRLAVAAAVVVLAAAGVAAAFVFTGHANQPAHHDEELNGYRFVYHPESTVTVVKQSFTDHAENVTLRGPAAAVGWPNASGGETQYAADFSLARLGASPGDQLRVQRRVAENFSIDAGNSTVPGGPPDSRFELFFHQAPAVTVVNVYANETDPSNLRLVGPHGSVTWANATLGSRRTAATFSYNRHAIGATAGDNVSLVRVDPQTGNRTTLTTERIP